MNERSSANESGATQEGRGAAETARTLPIDFDVYLDDFRRHVLAPYGCGRGSSDAPTDAGAARALVPPGTAALRDFSYVAPEIPELVEAACVGCMECVTECPDTAILAKVAEPAVLDAALEAVDDETERTDLRRQWTRTQKYFEGPQKRGEAPGLFGVFVDPAKCKGCGECVTACGEHRALRMVRKMEDTIPRRRSAFEFFRGEPPTPPHFIRDKTLVDMMLAFERSLLYVGGAGSCAGCGEATAIRMMLAASGFSEGKGNVGVVAATGCNTVFGSTYPYNPFLVPWTNSLFENAPAVAMGIRIRWNQLGWQSKRLWVIGGDGALYDIGFQSLSRLLASGLDVKVLVLDNRSIRTPAGRRAPRASAPNRVGCRPPARCSPGRARRGRSLR